MRSTDLRPLALCALLVSASASAYELKRDSAGEPVRWADGRVSFVVDASLAAHLGEPRALEAVQAAFEALDAHTPELEVKAAPGETHGVGYDFSGGENQSELVATDDWHWDSNAIAVTIVTVDAKRHVILDSDIALNTAARHFRVLESGSIPDGRTPFDDIQNTVTHELGHALGLAHNAELPQAVMYPSARRGEVSKRELSSDDEAALALLYGSGPLPHDESSEQDAAMGCSASGNARVGAFPLLLLLGLLWARRARTPRASRATAAAIGLLFAGAASASDVRRAPAPVKESQQTVTAEVVSRRTLAPRAGQRLLFTELRLRTVKCLKGSCEAELLILVPGGKLGDIEQLVEGSPVPVEGELVAVTLAPGPRTSAPEPTRVRLFRMGSAADTLAFVEGLARADLAVAPAGSRPPQQSP